MILRRDLALSQGKAAAKAVQAAINSFHRSPWLRRHRYLADGEGCQVVLLAEDEAAMRHVFDAACLRKLPCALYTESLAIGPATRAEVEGITDGLPLM